MERPIGFVLTVAWITMAATARIALAWYAGRLIRRAQREGKPGHAVYGLARAFGWIVGSFGGATAVLFGRVSAAASPTMGAAIWLGILLTVWWIYRGYTGQFRRVLGAVRSPEWDNSFHADFIALAQGPLLGVPIAAAAVALPLHLVADSTGTTVPPLAEALCIYPGILVSGAFLRFVARKMLRNPKQLPAEVAEHVERALGTNSSRDMAVMSTNGAAFYNALAIDGVPSASIWISEPLIEVLSPDAAAAVLVHEKSHVARRDSLRRLGSCIAIHAALLTAAFVWLPTISLPLSSLFFFFAFFMAITLLGQPQELAADAKAREVGLGNAMGRALVTLHQVNHVPRRTGSESFYTHPLLEKRLTALGVEIPEPTIGEAPIPRRRSFFSYMTWLIVLVLLALFTFVLARIAGRQ